MKTDKLLYVTPEFTVVSLNPHGFLCGSDPVGDTQDYMNGGEA